MLQLDVASDYAIRVAVSLAMHGGSADPAAIKNEMGLHTFQFQAAVSALRDAGIVDVERRELILLRDPRTLSLLDIVTAVEGEIAINHCFAPGRFCSRDAVDRCSLRKFYQEFQSGISGMLQNKHIQDLVEESEPGEEKGPRR